MLKNLYEARITAGFTQEKLAQKSGLTSVSISSLENGKSTARNGTQGRIEKALGVRVNWLKTRGFLFQQGEMTSWERVEQTYRKALFEINCLERHERIEFLKLAKQYLKEFSEGLEAAR